MFSKRTLIGGLVAFLVLFIGNWLLWGLVFNSTWERMSSAPMAADPDMLWLILGYAVLGWVFAYVYPLGFEGRGAVGEGARFGIVMWAVASLGMGLMMQAFQPDSLTAFFFGQFLNLIVYLLMGVALAMVMERHMEPGPPHRQPEGPTGI
ncbi:MAG: hypothetical protein R6W82_11930 [bacterium]